MFRYLLRRIAFLGPTLLVISLFAFALSKAAPGDPVELLLRRTGDDRINDLSSSERSYQETAKILGLDKPVFYVSMLPAAYPDTLYRVLNPVHRTTLKKLCAHYGNWPPIQDYFQALRSYDLRLRLRQDSPDRNAQIQTRRLIDELYRSPEGPFIREYLQKLEALHARGTLGSPELKTLVQAFKSMEIQATPWKKYAPGIQWYGLDNQYHHWLIACLQGDFGRSYRDGQPVGKKLNAALRWTLWLNLLSLFLAYVLSLPLGIYMAVYKGRLFDKGMQVLLFFLYALPSFWVATLLLIVFTHPDIGFQWISVTQIGEYPPEMGQWQRLGADLKHLVLPVFCLTYGSLAFITLQMRSAVVDTLQQDFIRTARAKGLTERQIIWKHAARNALFPIITLLGTIFPSMIAGSVIIESVFNLPGMGKLTIDSIFGQDWPVVYAVLLLSAALTIAGLLFADILYSWADPRVRLGKAQPNEE